MKIKHTRGGAALLLLGGAAMGLSGCDNAGVSQVTTTQAVHASPSGEGIPHGGPTTPNLQPVDEAEQPTAPRDELPPPQNLAEAFLERHCKAPEICTACERDAQCAALVPPVEGCAVPRCMHGVCALTRQAECTFPLPPSVLCGVSGPAGTRVRCAVEIVRQSAFALPAHAAAFDLVYPHSVLKFEGFEQAEVQLAVPPGWATPQGHQVSLRPPSPKEWEGSGRALISSPSGTAGAITEAYLDDAGIPKGGESVVVRAVFTLRHPTLAPVWVHARGLKLTGAGGQELAGGVQAARVVSLAYGPGCTKDGCGPATTLTQAQWTSLCELVGAAGDVRDCLIQVVRPDPMADAPEALEASLRFDEDALRVDNLYSRRCFDQSGCFDLPLAGPDAMATPTGHRFAFSPSDPAQWTDTIRFATVAPEAGAAPLGHAAMGTDGELSDDPVVAWVRVELTRDAPPEAPARVQVLTSGPHAPRALGPGGRTLPTHIRHGMFVTGAGAY